MLLEQRLRQTAGWLGAAAAMFGLIALTGWFQNANPFAWLQLNAYPMKPGAALCLILTGASLFLQNRPTAIARQVALSLAALTLAIVAAVLLQKWFGVGHGLDRLFSRDGDGGGTRMSVHSALALGALALAQLFVPQYRGRPNWPLSAWIANLVLGVSAASLLAGEFAGTASYTRPLRLSSHLAPVLVILALGTLLARPEDRHLRVLFARTVAGLLARRLLLGVAIVPLLLSAVLAALFRHDLITLTDGVLLLLTAMMVSGFTVALFSLDATAEVNERDAEAEKARHALNQQLQRQAEELQAAVTERTHELQEANERQREVAAQLEVVNERLQLALKSSRYGVWEFDVVSGRRIWDDRVHEMFGISRAEFDGSRAMWLERAHPEDRAAASENMRRVFAGETPEYAITFRIIRPDGSVRHLESHGYLQRDARGNPLRLVGLCRDITEQQRMAQALEAAEQRWQFAIEGTNDSAWDWEILSGRVFHDERWAHMLGYAPGELKDTHAAWKALVHPEDLDGNEAAIRAHFEQRAPFYQYELRVRAKDGSWRWILDRGKVVRRSSEGHPLRMAGTHRDVTTRKHLEQRLRKSEELAEVVSHLAQIGGWEVDLVTQRVTWTDGTRRIYEVDDSFSPSRETVWQFFPPDDVAKVRAAIDDLKPSAPSFDIQLSLLTARGNRRWVRMLGRGEFNHGRTITVHGAIQDVTAQHETAEARRELEARLFQAQKMETLGTLAGGIAHDFNNLLTGIIGYHELATDLLDETHPARPCMVEARNASLRARDLVDQILTFGRQGAGPEMNPVDLSAVIEEARRFLRATLPASIAIEVECASECSPVLGDTTQLHQVLLNLGSNAAHAMRERGGVLHLTLQPCAAEAGAARRRDAKAAGCVRLSVRDTGHGMDEATRKRIFDPFFTTKNTREGTGLGLAVVHGIVRTHGGTIEVESTPGVGSTFHLHFPTVAREKDTSTDQKALPPRGAGEFVCVVDDEDVVGTCTKLVLESKGYRCVTFNSAESCLSALQSNPTHCSVLLTDQTMPGVQGTQLAATLRRLAPDLPVVIMSGYFSNISPQALDALGQVELLGKPFTTDELVLAVDRALRSSGRKSECGPV